MAMSFRPSKRTLASASRRSRRARVKQTLSLFTILSTSLFASQLASANTEKDVLTTATALDSTSSYSSGTLPGTTDDLTFTDSTYGSTTFTLNTTALSIGTLDDLDTTQALTINGSQSITLNGGANSVSGTPGDLFYVATGANLTVATTGGITLAASGNFDIAGTAAINSAISGGFSITKTGAGTLTLGSANSYSGGTNINAGIVAIGNAGALGTTGTISFGGGTLRYGTGITTDFSNRFTSNTGQSYSIDIGANNVNQGTSLGGAGNSFTKGGLGTLTINTLNSFTGNYTVNGGTVQTGQQGSNGNSAFGSLASGRTVTINNGGTVLFTNNNVFGGGGSAAANIPTFVINAGGTLNSSRYNVIGDVTLNGGTLTQNASDGSGSGSYQAYQFRGGITVGGTSASTISAGSNGAGDHLDTNTIFNVGSTGVAGPDLVVSARLVNRSGDTGGGNGALTKMGAGTMALTAANIYNGTTTISAGTLQLGNGGTTGSLSTNSAITDNGTFAVNRTNTVAQGTDFSGNAITGTGGFTQAGAGTTTLTAANSYTGATTVNAGTLNLTGSLTSAVTVNTGGTLTGFGNGTTGRTTGSLTVGGGGTVSLAAANAATPFTVGGALTLGGTGSYGAGQFSTLNFTLGSGIEALNASGALTLNSGGAYIGLTGAIGSGTYNLLTYSSQTGAGAFSLSSTMAGVTMATIGRNTYTLLDNATSLQLQVAGAPIPGVAYFNGAVSSRFNDLSSATLVNFSTNLAGTTDAGNIPGAATDVILNASNAPAARTASETLGTNTTINSLNVNGNGTTTLAADGSTLTINALADSNTASDGSYTGNTAGTGINITSGANAFTVNVPVVLGNSQSWTNNSANLFTVGGTSVTGTAAAGNTQTLTLANTGAGGTTVSAPISDGSGGGKLQLTVNNTGTGATILTGNNNYSGGTTITAGTLQLNGTGVLGTGNVTDNGSLVYNTSSQTITNTISGTGTLAQNSSGVLTLNGNNSFSGGTTVNAGAIFLNSATGAGTGTITLAGTGALLFNNANFNNPLNITGNNVILNQNDNQDGNHTGALTGSGTLTVPVSVTVSGNTYNGASSFKYNGDISGFTGTFVDNTPRNVIFQGASTNGSNARFVVDAGSGNSTAFVGSNAGAGGIFQIGELSGASSTAVIYGNYNSGTTTVYQIGALNTNSTYNGQFRDSGGNGGGFTSIRKVGTGTLTLSGTNTNTGAMNVSGGGTLLINGNSSAATGAVTVDSGSTLGGNGNLGGAATFNGTVAPGSAANTIGMLTLSSTSGATISSTGIYLADIGATTSDNLKLLGAFTIANGATLTFNNLVTPTAASYDLANYTSINGSFTVMNLPAGYALSYGATELDLVAVPEPATWLTGALSLGTLVFCLRRRVRGMFKAQGVA